MTPGERVFDLPGYRLAALEWGEGRPLLALHGWLDNAGTFTRLAPLITGCHIVAFDAAGHGLSGNRSIDSAYNIWQEVGDVHDVAAELGWDRFSIIGHSRGAGVAMLFAAAFPERVDRMVFVDGGLPIVGESDDAPGNLAASVIDSRSRRQKSGRVFPTRDAAIAERMNGFTKVSASAAEDLAVRSLFQVEGGWQWRADQRLKARSEVRLTRELTSAFIAAVSAPILAFQAEQGPFCTHPAFVALLPEFRTMDLHRVPGGHHLHLEGAEVSIGRMASAFLAARDR